MAIGDAVTQLLGTATTNYQPAAGVETMITAIIKAATTDAAQIYDGTNTVNIIDAGAKASGAVQVAAVHRQGIIVTNTVYFRKAGTTDFIAFSGVQTK